MPGDRKLPSDKRLEEYNIARPLEHLTFESLGAKSRDLCAGWLFGRFVRSSDFRQFSLHDSFLKSSYLHDL